MARTPPSDADDAAIPDPDALLDHIRNAASPLATRDIARHFDLKGAQRAELRGMLRDLETEGRIERVAGRRWQPAEALPPVAILEVIGIDDDGGLVVRPVAIPENKPVPEIEVREAPKSMPAPGLGDRFVARLTRRGEGYVATPLRSTGGPKDTVVGIYRPAGDGGRIVQAERGRQSELRVALADAAGAKDGDLVLAEVLPARRLGLPQARVAEVIGNANAPGAISLIAIHRAGIPDRFPDAVVAEAEDMKPAPVEGRADLRDLPLVTIDGADARDFDDAVFAEPDTDHQNPGGWHLIVAIADVSWYVRPGSPLDREAYKRGNSVYFPDRVVPMLPEALSNDLCSLRPDEDRATMAVDMWIDSGGNLKRHRFRRAMIRSAARLTYDQVQDAHDRGEEPVAPNQLANLYAAYGLLSEARRRRGSLELELPERRIVLDEAGRVRDIVPVSRHDSHKLIEEFMIAANVAAARELIRLRHPTMFRIHDEPDPEKIADLREMLGEYGVKVPKGQVLRAKDFNAILSSVRGETHEPLINELILRSQMQASYHPENIGHFGLGLRDYAHFTSPIRRYADVLVHRALVRGLKLGDGGLRPEDDARFEEMGEHISTTERRAVMAERDANDRYMAAWLANHIGRGFTGTIRGVTRSGLFVAVAGSGAEGFIPASRLPGGRPVFDERTRTLYTPANGTAYRFGDSVEIQVLEADGLTSSALFELIDGGSEGMPPAGLDRGRRGGPSRGGPRKGGRKGGPPGRGGKGGGKAGGRAGRGKPARAKGGGGRGR